ncbi:hypothetical protein BC829DRAFT_422332 [Chytridium lagenaria]|nr:hypothetical protein BC829DRAFT_422332 [Chytridium lagenaria]
MLGGRDEDPAEDGPFGPSLVVSTASTVFFSVNFGPTTEGGSGEATTSCVMPAQIYPRLSKRRSWNFIPPLFPTKHLQREACTDSPGSSRRLARGIFHRCSSSWWGGGNGDGLDGTEPLRWLFEVMGVAAVDAAECIRIDDGRWKAIWWSAIVDGALDDGLLPMTDLGWSGSLQRPSVDDLVPSKRQRRGGVRDKAPKLRWRDKGFAALAMATREMADDGFWWMLE